MIELSVRIKPSYLGRCHRERIRRSATHGSGSPVTLRRQLSLGLARALPPFGVSAAKSQSRLNLAQSRSICVCSQPTSTPVIRRKVRGLQAVPPGELNVVGQRLCTSTCCPWPHVRPFPGIGISADIHDKQTPGPRSPEARPVVYTDTDTETRKRLRKPAHPGQDQWTSAIHAARAPPSPRAVAISHCQLLMVNRRIP